MSFIYYKLSYRQAFSDSVSGISILYKLRIHYYLDYIQNYRYGNNNFVLLYLLSLVGCIKNIIANMVSLSSYLSKNSFVPGNS